MLQEAQTQQKRGRQSILAVSLFHNCKCFVSIFEMTMLAMLASEICNNIGRNHITLLK